VRAVCEDVLEEPLILPEVLKRRAEGLKIIGEIYNNAGAAVRRTEKDQKSGPSLAVAVTSFKVTANDRIIYDLDFTNNEITKKLLRMKMTPIELVNGESVISLLSFTALRRVQALYVTETTYAENKVLSLPSGYRVYTLGPFDEGESPVNYEVNKFTVSINFFTPDSYVQETLIKDEKGEVLHRFVLRYRKVQNRTQVLPIVVSMESASLPPPVVIPSKFRAGIEEMYGSVDPPQDSQQKSNQKGEAEGAEDNNEARGQQETPEPVDNVEETKVFSNQLLELD